MRKAAFAGVVAICAVVLGLSHFQGVANADDAAATAAQINDGAFAMLNAVNANDAIKSNPALGAVAIFAGDANTLSHSMAAGDRAGAASALADLESDRGAVDRVVSANPTLFKSGDWNRIKTEMAALAKVLTPNGASARASGPPPAPAAGSIAGPGTAHAAVPAIAPVANGHATTAPAAASVAVPSTAPASVAATSSAPAAVRSSDSSRSAPPRVVIESRTAEGDTIHVKGYLEGSGLRRGGIYAGSHELRDFKVAGGAGEVRLNFDIGVESPTANEVIRVYDVGGRMAEAPIADATVAMASSASSAPTSSADAPTDAAPEIPPLPPAEGQPSKHAPSIEDGVEVFRNSTADESEGAPNTAEIPSHGTPRPSPSKRHTIGSHLANVQINISAANQIAVSPPTFEVVGQIVGHGVTRAGIYLDGRLARPITVEFGDDATNFDEKFTASGSEAKIRAYGIGDQYVESSLDLSSATTTASADTSMNPAAIPPGSLYGETIGGGNSGLLVQIAAVGPITHNLYVVSGVISGAHLSAAGLYQNGMLVQRIPIGGGGIGGVISSLIPGASHNVNFNVRFNPLAGPATIRAFDSSGGYNEQPVVIAGINPYGGVNPYGANPYGNAYGANPYGSPYGTNPYAVNPYGSYGGGVGTSRTPYTGGAFGPPPVAPLMPPTNPFGAPPASSSW
jgi:hypothetical protein